MAEKIERRLAAILSADVVGFSRLMEADEAGTLARLKAHRAELFDPITEANGGRIVKLMGDGALVEFPSVVDAVRYAIEVQRGMSVRNTGLPEDARITLRIGVNLGDVIIEGEDIYGDGVNIAARLQELAAPGGVSVSGKVHDEVRGKVEAAFEDLGEKRIKNIAQPIRVYAVTSAKETPVMQDDEGAALALPSKPSIAVLPFDNMSGDPEQEYFADGIAEDIITGLSHVRWLFVIARNSTFTYKDAAVDARQVARELGVRYVLEGSVRKAGSRVRISAQLIDAATGNHLWAERYDRELADVFDLQDEITETIVAAIEPELGGAEQERARRKPPEKLDAWDYVLRGQWHFHRFTKQDNEEARRLFRRAIEMDPGFARGHADLAAACFFEVRMGYTESPTETLAEGFSAARKALSLDDKDAYAHYALGLIYHLRGEHDSAIAELETAIGLNPSDARSFVFLGMALIYGGRAGDADPHLERALRLSPQDPGLWMFLSFRSLALVQMKKYDEAVKWARDAIRQPNVEFFPYAHNATALGHLGRSVEARAALDEVLRIKPDFSLAFVEKIMRYFRNPADLEHYLDGLRKAGLLA